MLTKCIKLSIILCIYPSGKSAILHSQQGIIFMGHVLWWNCRSRVVLLPPIKIKTLTSMGNVLQWPVMYLSASVLSNRRERWVTSKVLSNGYALLLERVNIKLFDWAVYPLHPLLPSQFKELSLKASAHIWSFLQSLGQCASYHCISHAIILAAEM